MKCNLKPRIQNPITRQIEQTQSTVKRIWEIAALLALHREFGFGKDRLNRFVDCLNEVYSEFTATAGATDKFDPKKRELTDIGTAIIKLIRELRECGVDHREIFGGGELVIIEEDGKVVNLDDVLDTVQAV